MNTCCSTANISYKSANLNFLAKNRCLDPVEAPAILECPYAAPTNPIRNELITDGAQFVLSTPRSACVLTTQADLCPATMSWGIFLPRFWVCHFVIGGPIRDFGIIHGPPFLHAMVHHLAPYGGEKGEHPHKRIAVGQLWCNRSPVCLQQRVPSVWFIMVVRMALQIDQHPIRRTMFRVP